MNTCEAVAKRILDLCQQNNLTINGISNISGIPPMTVYSMLYQKSKNPGIVNIKKLCDGFGITLSDFFDTPEFNNLEQEIK